MESAKLSFHCFFFYWYAIAIQRVEGEYFPPDHQKDVCRRIQFHNRTATVMPRFHLKSTVAEAFVAWKMLRMEMPWNEWQFMSYTQELGEYHTKRLKRCIEAMPELFCDYTSLTDAESILYYRLGPDMPTSPRFICTPTGILSFKRGQHPTGVVCDDILKDPQTKLTFDQLDKIRKIFMEEIEQMPKQDLHVFGTPQDAEDLFYVLEQTGIYDCKRYTAEADPTNRVALWEKNPMFCWDSLQKKRKLIGDKAYMKEFLCVPSRSVDGYISIDAMNSIICNRLKHYDLARGIVLKKRTVVGGYDIGKKAHPSHFAIFVESRKRYKVIRMNKETGKMSESKEKRLYQVHSKFLDGMDYIDQIDYIKNAISVFKLDKMYYDNTRSEFESTDEAGNLPSEMEPLIFTRKEKFALAAELDIGIAQRTIFLINDGRQKRQMMSVDCDLNAPSTAEGHGDSFFSNAMAVKASREANSILVWSPGDRSR